MDRCIGSHRRLVKHCASGNSHYLPFARMYEIRDGLLYNFFNWYDLDGGYAVILVDGRSPKRINVELLDDQRMKIKRYCIDVLWKERELSWIWLAAFHSTGD
eukprot:TRINITY_DN75669_c0_g1_i1.p1 TRINITY_DN75669_c0_g1~~TRINITY_DN75669_c0_g1_i1.p1  ORF type:complete len:102 (-),score=0.94 TRINITY_DN75669_c0_g1_i1:325-630(-)